MHTTRTAPACATCLTLQTAPGRRGTTPKPVRAPSLWLLCDLMEPLPVSSACAGCFCHAPGSQGLGQAGGGRGAAPADAGSLDGHVAIALVCVLACATTGYLASLCVTCPGQPCSVCS